MFITFALFHQRKRKRKEAPPEMPVNYIFLIMSFRPRFCSSSCQHSVLFFSLDSTKTNNKSSSSFGDLAGIRFWGPKWWLIYGKTLSRWRWRWRCLKMFYSWHFRCQLKQFTAPKFPNMPRCILQILFFLPCIIHAINAETNCSATGATHGVWLMCQAGLLSFFSSPS